MCNRNRRTRRGALAVETAIVLPVMLFCVLGIILGGLAVFSSQMIAYHARDAARYASVHGGDYQNDAEQNSPTAQQILERAVLPGVAGLDPAYLSIQVQWIDKSTNLVYEWDAAPKDVRSITPVGEYVSNTVRVTVRYQWTPGVFMDPITLQSVSEMAMTN